MHKQAELVNITRNGRRYITNAYYPEIASFYKDVVKDICCVFDSYFLDNQAMNWLYRGEVIPPVAPAGSHFNYYTQAQRRALLSKGHLLSTRVDPEAKAIAEFKGCEARNAETNHKFRTKSFSFEERTLLERGRAICHRMLGEAPDRLRLQFTTGATTLLKAKDAHLINKMREPLEVSTTSYPLLMEQLGHSGQFLAHLALCQGALRRHRTQLEVLSPIKYVHVNHTELFFVDKTYEQKRICMKERSGDMLLQRGCGLAIKKRLDFYAGKLDFRPSKHKWLVEHHFSGGGSENSDPSRLIATIDVKNASNSLAYELVKWFLPDDWFELLKACRSMTFKYPDGSTGRFEMFSSMGNGYTFELETLIFEVLALTIRESHGQRFDRVSVFGDDIIIADYLAEPLIRLLGVCGFETNIEKTYFGSVPFRESCGYDCYKGMNARPIFFKGNPLEDDWVKLLYTLANNIFKLSLEWPSGHLDDVLRDVVDSIPPYLRVGGPVWLGDRVLHGIPPNCDELGRQCLLVPWFDRILPEGPDETLAYALSGNPSSGLAPRSRVPSGYKVVVLDNGWEPES